MPRMGRVVLPNYPHHVVQRGHNRQVVFAAAEDYQRYLTDLRELKDAFGVKVYAYCLMTNHVHMLLAPGGDNRGQTTIILISSNLLASFHGKGVSICRVERV